MSPPFFPLRTSDAECEREIDAAIEAEIEGTREVAFLS
jgi:hypothetical protein